MNRNLKYSFLAFFSFVTFACSTPQNGKLELERDEKPANKNTTSRAPSSANGNWNLESLLMNSKWINGKCDLSPTNYIRRSNIKSASTLVASTKLDQCKLSLPSQKPQTDGLFVSATYLPSLGNRFTLEVTAGDFEYATDESEDSRLSSLGYFDAHIGGKGVYKIKPSQKFEFSGECGQPEAVGMLGFRKLKVTCKLSNNEGEATLVSD